MALGGTNFKLRSNLERAWTFVVTAPSAGYTAGQLLLVGDTVGVVVKDADEGDEVAVVFKAEKILVPCVAATSGSFDVGDKVYYDVADAEVNQSAGGNYLCGVVVEVPTVGDEEVLIALDGTLNIVA
jgi:predicted RecA/RadA family phage recombinase